MADHVEHARGIFRDNSARTFLIEPATGTTRTFGEVARETLRLADALARLGVAPGRRVALLSVNALEVVYLLFAIWHRGGIAVPVNPQLSTHHLREILESADPVLVLGTPDVLKAHGAALSAVPNAAVVSFVPKAHGARLQAESAGASIDTLDIWGVAAEGQAAGEPFGALEDSSIFLRIYTSGSTAAPKGIDIRFDRLYANERVFCDHLGITRESRFFNILPMSYLGGVHNLILLPFSAGASVVVSEPLGGANLYGFWETVQTHGINTLWFTAAMLNMLMALRDEDERAWTGRAIKLALVGMAPLTRTTKVAFETRFGFPLYENYALSETAFITSERAGRAWSPDSKGSLLPGITLDFLDDEGKPLPAGEPGEIFVRTPHLLAGYINASEADVANIRPDGFRTGDLGFMKDGELFVVGRKKDLIIRGGLNIAPAMIEAVLTTHPAVDQAAVVGIADPIYGEEVAAAVTLAGGNDGVTAEDILTEAARHLAQFQRPKTLRIVADLPKGLTGKIDKTAVRALLTAPSSEGQS